jgi:hypothetical protein
LGVVVIQTPDDLLSASCGGNLGQREQAAQANKIDLCETPPFKPGWLLQLVGDLDRF